MKFLYVWDSFSTKSKMLFTCVARSCLKAICQQHEEDTCKEQKKALSHLTMAIVKKFLYIFVYIHHYPSLPRLRAGDSFLPG